jgi:triacylglycerol lipase
MVHGVFFRDSRYFNYWGRIPKELEQNGAAIYYGNHQSAASIEKSGEELAQRIRELVAELGCEKVNVIAHSKGGLDCRYALSKLDIAPYVASLTTINTPHRGCLFADCLLTKVSPKVKDRMASAYNTTLKKLGDSDPDFLTAINQLTATRCADFNQRTSIPEGVYCQSVGSVLPKARGGKFPLNFSHHIVSYYDGENDGLAGERSFPWGERYICLRPQSNRGISHGDMIDLNRQNFDGFDVREFYVNLVSELKDRGL